MPVAIWGDQLGKRALTHYRPVETVQGIRDTEVGYDRDETADKIAQTDGERRDEEAMGRNFLHALTELNQKGRCSTSYCFLSSKGCREGGHGVELFAGCR